MVFGTRTYRTSGHLSLNSSVKMSWTGPSREATSIIMCQYKSILALSEATHSGSWEISHEVPDCVRRIYSKTQQKEHQVQRLSRTASVQEEASQP